MMLSLRLAALFLFTSAAGGVRRGGPGPLAFGRIDHDARAAPLEHPMSQSASQQGAWHLAHSRRHGAEPEPPVALKRVFDPPVVEPSVPWLVNGPEDFDLDGSNTWFDPAGTGIPAVRRLFEKETSTDEPNSKMEPRKKRFIMWLLDNLKRLLEQFRL